MSSPHRPARTPVSQRDYRDTMAQLATGVTIITTRSAPGAFVGFTANSFNSVSLEPPLVAWSLARRSRSAGVFEQAARYCVNVLAESQRGLVARFAAASGDRFAGVTYHWEHEVPVLDGAAAAAVCAVDRIVTAADHALVLGSPRWSRQASVVSA